MNILKNVPTVIYAIIFITMFLPFITVQCNGEDFVTLTATQLATGTTIQVPSFNRGRQTKKTDVEPLATLTIIIVIIGFGVSLIKKKKGYINSVVISVLGIILLLALNEKMRYDIAKESEGVGQIKFLFGYWLAVFLFIINTFVSGSLVNRENTEKDEESSIICPDCGTKNESSSKFCSSCGKPLNEVKTKTTSSDTEEQNIKTEKKECINCGSIIEISEEEIKKGSYFCPNCGTLNKINL